MTAPLAFITAGTRRVGAAIAGELARRGWRLALHARADATLDPALADVLAETGVAHHQFIADLADPEAIDRLWAEVTAWGGVPSLVVNNASLFLDDDAASATAVSIRRHQAVNCDAPVQLTRLLWRDTPEGQQAASVLLLDQRIAHPHGDQFAYTLSKLALAAALPLLARSLAPRVRVNAVAPGLTLPTADYSPAQMQRLAALMPLERLPDPAALASAVAWLAEAPAVTGQTIFVDGGAHLVAFDRDFVALERDEAVRPSP
ncbi:SDR family oxidoreductase [Sandarakinorhabdus rubra]|uniref:SDR family oxidoreductase n=1 Tax=Sandarakinorhabdus rubra TaxID=2672568 RepID=UPI0013DCA280|nr:SDR family oxidoreductase [Sandarakinorhabdus rubra]